MKQGLSIRYKILLLLTIVPLVTLGLYLFMAVYIFKKDKIPYIYDSTLSIARTLSSQVTTELNGTLSSAKPAMQEFISSGSFGPISKAIFDSDGRLDWISVFHKTADGSYQRDAYSEKLSGVAERDLKSFGNLVPLLTEVSQAGRVVRVPFKDERVLLAEKVLLPDTQEERIFLILAHLDELANGFRSANGEVFLTNAVGFILLGPVGKEATYLSERIPTDFLTEARDQKSSYGTKEVEVHSGQVMIASFSRVNFADLEVVSLVQKKEALVAVDELIRKSVVFFVLLISLSTIASLVASSRLTAALTDLFSATRRVAEGKFDIQVPVNTQDEVGSLADSFNVMASEVSRLLGETAEKARMESELKTAQTVQETLFPPARAEFQGMRIAGYYEPASECGGDWWHYSQVDNKIYLWIGDATGHGAPAALITSAAKSAATIIERLNVDPSHAMELLNRAIYDVGKGRLMMTFFLGCFDLETKELTYCIASHEGPYLIKTCDRPLKKSDLIPLNEVNSPRLGQDRDCQFEQTTIKLDAGDRLLLYTDGIPDIENPDKKNWGEREFLKAIIESNTSFPSIDVSIQKMIDSLSNFRQGAPLIDDVTFFMVEITGDQQGKLRDPETQSDFQDRSA